MLSSTLPSRSRAAGHRIRGPLVAASLLLLLDAAGCSSRGSGAASNLQPALTLPATVTAGQSGYQASMAVQAGATYAWTISNGAITFEDGGATIRFTAGTDTSRPLTLACTVTANGASRTYTGQAALRHGPAISTPQVAVLHQGAEVASTPAVPGGSYTWTVTGGQLLSGQGTNQITYLPTPDLPAASRRLQALAGGPRALAATPNVTTLTLVETDGNGTTETTTLELPEIEDTTTPPAAFAYTPASATATVGQSLTALMDASEGGSITGFQISPDLPAGLTLDPETGFISGTPTAAAPTASYTITASNAAGSAQANVSLTVLPAPTRPPAGLSYSPSTVLGSRNTAITPLVPSFTGGDAATTFAVAPALPAGLSLGSDGTISGIPTGTAASASYLITASNSAGSTTASVTLAVAESAPAGFSYTPASVQGARNVPLTPLVPAFAAGGPAATFSVSPDLPSGLALGPDGTISGTPTSVSDPTSYTVTAGNGAGLSTATVTIAVAESAPAGFSYPAGVAAGQRTVAFSPLAPVFLGGGPATGFTIDPPLPAGLTLGPDGSISGTPTVIADPAVYTVTASNSAGQATATLSLLVVDLPPAGFSYAPGSATTDVGLDLATLAPSFTGGGPATSFTVSPSLPAGLILGPDGSISGTPTANLDGPAYTGTFHVIAGNTGGSTGADVTLTVRPAAPTVAITPGSLSLLAGRFGSLGTSATGAPPYTYAWSKDSAALGAAGASLALAAVTAANAGSYQVTVTDALGRTATSPAATVTVNPVLPRFAYLGHGDYTLSMFTVDGTNGRLRAHGFVGLDTVPDLLATTPDSAFLFAADKADQSISSYALDASSGRPALAGPALAMSGTPLQLLVEPSGTYLYVLWKPTHNGGATGATLSAYAIAADGTLGAAATLPAGIFPAGVRPVSMVADPLGRALIVADSANQVRDLAIGANGALAQVGSAVSGGASAPVLAVNPSGTTVYALSATGSSHPYTLVVNAYQLDGTGLTANAGASLTRPSMPLPVTASFDGTGSNFYLYSQDPSASQLDAFTVDGQSGALTWQYQPTSLAGTQALLVEPTNHLVYGVSASTGQLLESNLDGTGAAWAYHAVRSAPTALALASGSAAVRHTPGHVYTVVSGSQNYIEVANINASTGVATAMSFSSFIGLSYSVGFDQKTLNAAGTRFYTAGGTGRVDAFAIAGNGTLAAAAPPVTTGLSSIESIAIDPSDTYAVVIGRTATNHRILVYQLDPATGAPGTLLSTTDMPSTNNQSALVNARFDPRGQAIYVVMHFGSTFKNTLYSFSFDWQTGTVAVLDGPINLDSGLPGTNNQLRQLRIHPNGTAIYVPLLDGQTLGNDALQTFALDPLTGRVTLAGSLATGAAGLCGELVLAPDGHLGFTASVQNSSAIIRSFALDASGLPTGSLTTQNVTAGTISNISPNLSVDPSGQFLYEDMSGTKAGFRITDPVAGTLQSISSPPWSGIDRMYITDILQ